ncbi:MAG: PorP/SprF family type IX secretion system membrane protein, partial [Bacteroidia bacterium]
MKKLFIVLLSVLFLQISALNAQQQIENSMSQYYRNRMLGNAAFTGADGNKVYVLQNNSWTDFEGAPRTINLSGEFGFGKNSAIGVHFMSDKAGILNRSFGVFNYAYRLQFNDHEQLRLGVALSFSGDRLNEKYIEQGGGAIDPAIIASVKNQLKFDGNFGMVYTRNRLTLSMSLYRLSENLRNEKSYFNLATSLWSIDYNLPLDDRDLSSLKPMLLLRSFRGGAKAVADIGLQYSYHNLFQLTTIYQTTGNLRLGTGLVKDGLGEANF